MNDGKSILNFIPNQPGEYLCSEFWDGEQKPFRKVSVYWKSITVDKEGNTRKDLVFRSSWSEYTRSVHFSLWRTEE